MSFWRPFKKFLRTDRTASDLPYQTIEKLIGHTFQDRDLLRLSLTHRSLVRSLGGDLPSNERLEFLGDSVLGLVIADQLYRDHAELSEGDLTKMKAMLVNEGTLAAVACDIGLNEHVLLSPEEEKAGGHERPSIISDAFESVIGAVYLDGGLAAARQFVLRGIYSRRDQILADKSLRNYKGDLLELVQARGEGVPRYEIVSETGPDHDKTFRVVVLVAGGKAGEGSGSSKKEAEQRAAEQALENYQ